MTTNMLGKLSLPDVMGPVNDLLTKLAGKRGPEGLPEFKRFLREWEKWEVNFPNFLDCSERFLVTHVGDEGWSIDEQDDRSPAKLDLNKIVFDIPSCKSKSGHDDQRHYARLERNGRIRLGANVWLALINNEHLIPESWKGKIVYFDGTILRTSDGYLQVLYLSWNFREWSWGSCAHDDTKTLIALEI